MNFTLLVSRSHLSGLVVLHDKFERTQKVLLEVEVLKLALLQKLEGQLPGIGTNHWLLEFTAFFVGMVY